MTAFSIVIPARYNSTRLPGKMLCDVGGKTLIERTVARALQSVAERVIVATDDTRIAEAVATSGCEICITDKGHSCGTERVAEAVKQLAFADDSIVVNVQGDEPLIAVDAIHQVATMLRDYPLLPVATAACAITDRLQLQSAQVVKVVFNRDKHALYFSRAVIPYARDASCTTINAWRHLGIYAYRAQFLSRYLDLPVSPLEEIEKLEQLRMLEVGATVGVTTVASTDAISVDTADDLERLRRWFNTGTSRL